MRRYAIALMLLMTGLAAVSCGTKTTVSDTPDYEMSYTVGDATLEMAKVPAGNLTMGLTKNNRGKVKGAVAQGVALDGFVISSAPVSQALWTAVMGSNPSSGKSPAAPVDMVSWMDIQKFIAKLNKATGKTFSLPTEAQWEYSCKTLDRDFMTVAEWCSDVFDQVPDGARKDEYFDPSVLKVNPQGPEKGDNRVVRTPSERTGVEPHTARASVSFSLVQKTEDVLSEEMLAVLDGNTVVREPVETGDWKPETITVGDVSFKMIKVKGGTFNMGFTPEDSPYPNFKVPDNEKNAHLVTLDDFALGETEVTVELWNAVMGSVPALNKLSEPKKAVGNVSWYDCQIFIRKLNELTGRKFRLPTEAEWEYAARGGSLSRRYGFSGGNDMNTVMWYVDNANMKMQQVARKKANELGLYDMSGNAWEWCSDKTGDYPTEAQTNPAGPLEGGDRVLRGGSGWSRWDACRITNRSFMPAVNIKNSFGLRLAL